MLPDFLIVGTARGGTCSLWSYLHNHPDVFLAESYALNFFNSKHGRSLNWYKRQFKNNKGERAIGEVASRYMDNEYAPVQIYKIIPDIKLVFSLRNPIIRAYSHYWLRVSKAEEPRSFEESVKQELYYLNSGSKPRCFPYISIGFYYQHVERYLRYFDREQMYFIVFEDFIREPLKTIKDICNFWGISSDYVPPNIGQVVNPALHSGFSLRHKLILDLIYHTRRSLAIAIFLSPRLRDLYLYVNHRLQRLHRKINLVPGNIPEMNNNTRELLRSVFQKDKEKLQDLLKCDLSHWK